MTKNNLIKSVRYLGEFDYKSKATWHKCGPTKYCMTNPNKYNCLCTAKLDMHVRVNT